MPSPNFFFIYFLHTLPYFVYCVPHELIQKKIEAQQALSRSGENIQIPGKKELSRSRTWPVSILSVCVQKHEILKISYTFPTPFCSLENASWGSSHSCTIMVQEYPHRKMRNKTGVWAPRLIFITFLFTPHVPQDVFSFTSWTMLARTIAILIITKLDSCCESTWKIL